jgi:hypothetical protein
MFMMRLDIPKITPAPPMPRRTGKKETTKKAYRPDSTPFTDENGQGCLRVPLDRRGERFAIVAARDYWRVVEAGATGPWLLNDNGSGRSYVRTSVPSGKGHGTLVQVARIISGAGPRTVIRYDNGDTCDLRAWNLSLQRGKAKRSDAALALRGQSIRAARAAV